MEARACAAELAGTFTLVFIGAGAVAVGVGGLLGAAFAHGFVILAQGVSHGQTLVLEAILTFMLVTAILNTAVSGKGGDLAPFAIGLTLIFCILMGGPLTGASLNPARTLGPGLFTNTLNVFWVYLAGTFLGAALAGGLYRGMPRSSEPLSKGDQT